MSLIVFLGIALVFGTVLLYSPLRTHDFINYDDKDYVVDNPHVTAGLNWQALRWSLTATEQANWHPVTWLSHALDCQFFGLDAGSHHLTSLLIHTLNILLLFLLLQRASGMLGRSFLVAAIFAWHPFNVQSVAWVAERKNLLSTFFLLLAIGSYGWYAQKPQLRRLIVVAVVSVLALASKPMAVSLPFVFLLLDYWPLQRVAGLTNASSRLSIPQQPVWRLLAEKSPLFTLSALSCVVTVWAQRLGGALRSLQRFPLPIRLENAIQSYGSYVIRTCWPFGFSVFYPFTGSSINLWKVLAAAALLCAVTVLVWRHRQNRPYLLVGWLWFLGTLVPVIGIVQVGDQAMADRYAYLTLIGLFIVIVWGAFDFLDWRRVGSMRWGLTTAVLLALCLVTFREIGYWKNSATIWSRALRVTGGNLLVEKQLANALVMSGEREEAWPHLVNIAQLDPDDATIHVNLGSYYAAKGRLEDAKREFETVVQLTDHKDLSMDDQRLRTSAFLNLAFAFIASKDYSRALIDFQRASDAGPAMVDKMIADFGQGVSASTSEGSYITLSLLLRARGRDIEAESILEQAVKANPEYVDSMNLLKSWDAQPKPQAYLEGRVLTTSKDNLGVERY